MSRKSLQQQYIMITAKINTISKKEMELAYLSVRNNERIFDEAMKLRRERYALEDEASIILRKINKPRLFRRRNR